MKHFYVEFESTTTKLEIYAALSEVIRSEFNLSPYDSFILKDKKGRMIPPCDSSITEGETLRLKVTCYLITN